MTNEYNARFAMRTFHFVVVHSHNLARSPHTFAKALKSPYYHTRVLSLSNAVSLKPDEAVESKVARHHADHCSNGPENAARSLLSSKLTLTWEASTEQANLLGSSSRCQVQPVQLPRARLRLHRTRSARWDVRRMDHGSAWSRRSRSRRADLRMAWRASKHQHPLDLWAAKAPRSSY